MSRVKFGDVAREVRDTWDGPIEGAPVVGLEHLDPDETLLSRWDAGTAGTTFSKRFRKGQLLFGRRRAYQRKAAVAPFDGICSGDITVIEARPDRLLPSLLPFLVQNPAFFEHAVRGSAGSLSPRVKWAFLADYEFDLPDLPRQRALAEKFAALRDAKDAYGRLLAATDELVKSQFSRQERRRLRA